jgi:hypothetical protein
MADPCKNCGSELFAGQRFCRACGNPTDTLDAGEAVTQQFTDGPAPGEATTRHMSPPDDWGARSVAHTAPQARPNTNPVGRPPDTYQPPQAYQAPPTSYQMPPPPPVWQAAQYAPQAAPSRSGAPWAIVLAIILALMLGAMIAGRAIYNNIKRRIPAIQQQQQQQQTVASTDKKVFPLANNATVTIKTTNGSIKVEGWDEPRAEVQIIKKVIGDGPSVTVRSDNDKSLYLEAPGDGRGGQVSFEVKLPRQLGVVSFNSTNGTITVSDVAGQLTIETTNGKIKLDDVSGIDRAKTTNGGIEATIGQTTNNRPMTFETTNGGIDLQLQDDFNGTLDASAMHGGIKVDDAFEGVKVEKVFPTGQRANGVIGSGGPTLTLRTINGGIRVSK